MVTVRDVEYEADGTAMVGRLALPDGDEKCAGVLIGPEANGISDHQRSRAEQLARCGYAALALDLHGGGRMYTEREPMMERVGELSADPDRVRAIARAGLDVLRHQLGAVCQPTRKT